MSAQIEMQRLTKSIKNPILFYFSKQGNELIKAIDVDPIEHDDLFDTMFICDMDGQTRVLTDLSELLILIDKAGLLESNLFDLMTLRSSVDASAYKYLIGKYTTALQHWIDCTALFKNNAHKDLKTFRPEVQGYLDLQHEVLLHHRFEINLRLNTEPIRVPNITPGGLKLHKPTSKKSKSKHRSKKVMISAEDVDHYLLESIFHVDFDKISSL